MEIVEDESRLRRSREAKEQLLNHIRERKRRKKQELRRDLTAKEYIEKALAATAQLPLDRVVENIVEILDNGQNTQDL